MPELVTVARVGEIPDGGRKMVQLKEREVVIINLNGEFYAIQNLCPHEGGPVGEGDISDGEIICPWHGWMFQLKTGKCEMVDDESVVTYPVEVVGDEIKVAV